jgi:hypothetical protein
LSIYEVGTDCDDTDASLNYHDYDGDGQSSCDGDCDDGNTHVNTLDLDSDGQTSCGEDCNDTDADIFVGSDKDGDGFLGCGLDCSENNILISPVGEELLGDGIDQNCDGEDLIKTIAIGSDNFCVLEKDNDLFCWGEDNSIQQDIPKVDFTKVEFHQDENIIL